MKIKVDNDILFELTETQKNVIKNDIPSEEFDEDIKRRLQWVVMHKYAKCLTRLKTEWLPKLKELGVQSIPLDDDAFAELVFSRSEYKDRSAKEKEKQKEKDLRHKV